MSINEKAEKELKNYKPASSNAGVDRVLKAFTSLKGRIIIPSIFAIIAVGTYFFYTFFRIPNQNPF